jgi:hypothetical protein
MGIVKAERELPVQHPTLPIFGHMDMRLTMQDGWQYAFDYKTMSSKGCAKTYEPTFKHRTQLLCYMGPVGITAGYFIYENKDTQVWLAPMERFRVDFDPQIYAEIEQFCLSILEMARDQRVPKFSEAVCDSCITFCHYREICKKERAKEITWKHIDGRTEDKRKFHLTTVT